MANRQLGTASFFIDIDNGDAAVHIMYSFVPGNAGKTVESAILMDGGAASPFGSTSVDNMVYRTIADIEDQYICQGINQPRGGTNPLGNPRNRLMFDSFVVTHWDHDHYQGVLFFLREDITTEINAFPLRPHRLSRAFYDQLANGTWVPRSTFYAPSWKRNYLDGTRPHILLQFRTPHDAGGIANNGTQLFLDSYMEINTGGNRVATRNWVTRLLRMRIGHTNLLGRNLFERDGDIPAGAGNAASPQVLLGAHAPLYPQMLGLDAAAPRPGMFCVAVHRRVLSGVRVQVLTETNKSSICCILGWTPGNYISLYTAGDAHADLDSEISRWIGYVANDGNAVTIYKLSHHGSAESSPHTQWGRLKPQHIVSMSSDRRSYGHPRWEIMHDLFTWMMYSRDPVRPGDGALQLTKWPAWLEGAGVDNWDRIRMNEINNVVNRLDAGYDLCNALMPPGQDLALPMLLIDVYWLGWPANYNLRQNDRLMRLCVSLSMLYEIGPMLAYDFVALEQNFNTEYIRFEIVGIENNALNNVRVKYVGGNLSPAPVWQRMAAAPIIPHPPAVRGLSRRSGGRSHGHIRSQASTSSVWSNASTLSWDLVQRSEDDFGNEDDEGDDADDDEDGNNDDNVDDWNLLPLSQKMDRVAGHRIVPEGIDKMPPGSTVIPKASVLHGYLLYLAGRGLVLQAVPEVQPGSRRVRVPLSLQDEWNTWLQQVLLLGRQAQVAYREADADDALESQQVADMLAIEHAEQKQKQKQRKMLYHQKMLSDEDDEPLRLYVEASAWPPTAATSFAFDMQASASLADGSTVRLAMDSRTAPAALGVGQTAVDAMLRETRVMALGVTVTKSPAPGWTLEQVVELVQFEPRAALTPLLPLLPLPLQPVAPAGGGRSALWQAAGSGHLTTLRLEFAMADGARDAFAVWLGATKLDMAVTRVSVVARRHLRYVGSGGGGMSKEKARVANSKLSKSRLPGRDTVFARGEITFAVSVILGGGENKQKDGMPFTLLVTVTSDKSLRLRLQRDEGGADKSELRRLLEWAVGALGDGAGGQGKDSAWWSCQTWLEAAGDFLDAVRPRVVEIELDCDDRGMVTGVSGASLTLQVGLKTGKPDPGSKPPGGSQPVRDTVVFFVTFAWSRSRGVSMKGKLWCSRGLRQQDSFAQALPVWEKALELRPSQPERTLDHIDLKKLLGITSLPAGVPTEVTQAEISISGEAAVFKGALACTYDKDKDKAKRSDMPVLALDQLQLYARRTWADKVRGTPASWDVGLQVDLLLHYLGEEDKGNKEEGKSESEREPARLMGAIQYSNGGGSSSWALQARIDGLAVAHLAQFWAAGEVRDAAMALLKHIEIEYVSLAYSFGGGDGDGASSFQFDGKLRIGGLGLTLDFHQSTGQGWQFSAKLGRSKKRSKKTMAGGAGRVTEEGDKDDDGDDDNDDDDTDDDTDEENPCTVKTFLQEIVGKGVALPDSIPGAVLDIPLGRPDGDGEVLGFTCALAKGKRPDDKDPSKQVDTERVVLTASIDIAKVSLTFVQWRDTSWAAAVPSKRVVKVSLSEVVPAAAPLVGQLRQPFEQLAYMWVADRTGEVRDARTQEEKKQKQKAGITMAEITALAPFLPRAADTLFYRTDTVDPDKTAPGDVMIEAGSHFMVVAKNSHGTLAAVLDYVFGRPKPPKPKPKPKPKSKLARRKTVSWVDEWEGGAGREEEEGQLGEAGGPEEEEGQLLAESDETHPKGPATAPFKKSAGALSIENIGLTFDLEKQRLGIKLDATFLLGPIGLALIGFGLSVQVGKLPEPKPKPKLCGSEHVPSSTCSTCSTCSTSSTCSTYSSTADGHVTSITLSKPEVTLDGLLVSFERPPLTIAGGFVRTKMDGATYYAGGLIVGFTPWQLSAIGVYGEVPRKKSRPASYCVVEGGMGEEILSNEMSDVADTTDPGSFTMVFIIVKIEGPLFSVGFVDLSGLTAGVGINSHMRLPTAETVLDFPLTRTSGTPAPSAGPLAALRALLNPEAGAGPAWFSAREGSMWVAAGVKATAFTMLAVDAVLVVQVSPDVQLGIFGAAVLDVPSLAAPVKFAHAELGIACVLDPAAGAFRFDAQLSPRSFVLHESCHLTGGMAMYAWFAPLRPGGSVTTPGDPNRPPNGDWVLTIGGYHQAFVRPAAYPNPPRLGIAWALGSSLRISGEAYFAVTPRFCMAGGRLHASLTLGALSAWFDAFLDLLINFRPFKFAADGRISVGVRFSMDLWLVTVRISAEIGAVLSVLGPPMAGRVHVDFWVFGFDIDFGDRDRAIRMGNASSLGLLDFAELVLKGGGQASGIGMGPPGLPMLGGGWVDVDKPKKTDANNRNDRNDRNYHSNDSAAPFLFSCTAGLLTDSDVPGSTSGGDTTASWMATMFDGEPVPANAWAVRAGELAWTVTCAFAASAAVFCDTRPDRPPIIREEEPVDIPVAQATAVCALPMRLTEGLTSKVRITITQKKKHVRAFGLSTDMMADDEGGGSGDKGDDGRRDDCWDVRPILKSVPRSLWGAYDAKTDPALNGNAVSALLNAPTAKGSVDLVAGFAIRPPLPHRSKDRVPPFNLVEDMRVSVRKGGYAFIGEHGTAADQWQPAPPPPPGTKPAARWTAVQEAWDAQATEDRAQEAVRQWSADMGWGAESEDKNDNKDNKDKKTTPPPLTGRRPRALLRRFLNMVPAAPMMTVKAGGGMTW